MNKLMFVTVLALALSFTQVAAQSAAMPVSLGVQFLITEDGPEVTDMLPGRTGVAIGFKLGDILLEAGGKPVSEQVLMEYLKSKKPGDTVSFKVKRADAEIELTGKALATPAGAPAPGAEGI